MTLDKNSKTLIISLIALIIILLAVMLERRDVPVVKNWNENYRYELKDPYDTSALKEALEFSFGEDNISLFRNIDSIQNFTKSLYINIGYDIYLNENKSLELLKFMENGNSVLLITDIVSSSDTLINDNDVYIDYKLDSLDQVVFLDTDSLMCDFKYYYKNTEEAYERSSNYFSTEIELDSNYVTLAMVDTMVVFQKTEIGQGTLYRYTSPYHFSNIASLQDDFRSFYNHIFQRFDVTNIIIDRPQLADRIESNANNSPIKYILAQPSLKWAYYLTILLALLYIIFKGKRKQKIIPLQPKNENTSLEYVDTLSQLFLVQKQNVKLIDHMEDQFYHKVQKRYFIDKRNTNFADLLSKKSKVDTIEIKRIMDSFYQASAGYAFTDEQLHRLFNNLNHLYTKWK